MNDLDIIVYAVIALVVLGRLWFVFGRRNEDEPQRPNPFATSVPPTHDDEDVMVMKGRNKDLKALPAPAPMSRLLAAPTSLEGGLQQVKLLDVAFNEKQFLQDVRVNFALIVGDFAKGDLTDCEKFLTPAMRDHFQRAINGRREAGEQTENQIKRITECEVTAAKTEESKAILTVRIVSEQVNILRDAKGEIMHGAVGQSEEITDIWIFCRDTSMAGAEWQLGETR